MLLPDAVRSRIVALSAEALPAVTQLPPALKRVAEFAPSRRARLGASQITASLAYDETLRGRVATQVLATHPELAKAMDAVDAAAYAWLSRPEGWEDALGAAVDAVASRDRAVASEREVQDADRLRQKLADAEQQTRDVRARYKQQLDELKAENASLRRKLRESRDAERAAAEEAARARSEIAAVGTSAQQAATAMEGDVRRLRARVEELQAQLAATRRDVRSERDEATIRARLLLDTLLESAQGLRRELALPAVSGAPGDRVEGELAEQGVRTTSAAGALGPTSSALLEQYLALPRVRLIIDGYNVSMTAWPESPLEAQRIRLLNGMAPLVARSGAETTVVFDAAATAVRPPVNPPRGVKVLFSPEGVIADDVIRDLVAAEPQGRVVVVVTSDQEVVADVRRAGARAVASEALIGLLAPVR